MYAFIYHQWRRSRADVRLQPDYQHLSPPWWRAWLVVKTPLHEPYLCSLTVIMCSTHLSNQTHSWVLVIKVLVSFTQKQRRASSSLSSTSYCGVSVKRSPIISLTFSHPSLPRNHFHPYQLTSWSQPQHNPPSPLPL